MFFVAETFSSHRSLIDDSSYNYFRDSVGTSPCGFIASLIKHYYVTRNFVDENVLSFDECP